MQMWEWAAVSGLVVTTLGLAGGYFLKASIEKGIQYRLDKELETLKAQLRAKDEQIASIRSGVLDALKSRHETLNQRRLVAAEKLWAAVTNQTKFKMAVAMVSSMNIDAILKASAAQDAEGEKIRMLGEMLWQTSGLEEAIRDKQEIADQERLFVPPLAWAAFKALRSVNASAVAVLATVKTGVGPTVLKGNSHSIGLIKEILPNYGEFLDKYPDIGIYHLVEPIEEYIYKELVSFLADPDFGKKAIEQAAAIAKYAEELEVQKPDISIPEEYLAKDNVGEAI